MYVTLLYPPCDKVNAAYYSSKARHIRKVVLCVLLEEWSAVLGKVAEDPRIPIRGMLGGFSTPEHQNIRKAVLCVLPKEFCVRRSEKTQ